MCALSLCTLHDKEVHSRVEKQQHIRESVVRKKGNSEQRFVDGDCVWLVSLLVLLLLSVVGVVVVVVVVVGCWLLLLFYYY